MFQEAERIRGMCLSMQAKAVGNWLFGAFAVLVTFQPAMLIAKYDFGVQMDTWIVCLPVTISWGALIVIQISQWFKICRHHRNVHSL